MGKEQYKKALKSAMEDFRNSYRKIIDLCYDSNNNINDYIVEDYPFNLSFDELEIEQWVATTIEKINNEK